MGAKEHSKFFEYKIQDMIRRGDSIWTPKIMVGVISVTVFVRSVRLVRKKSRIADFDDACRLVSDMRHLFPDRPQFIESL